MKNTNTPCPRRQGKGDTASCVMLALVATALAFCASSVMSLHRWCKYIITALSLHVWTVSKTPSQGHLSAEKPSPADCSPAPDAGHTLSPATHPPGEPEKHWRFLFPRTQNRHDSLEKCIKISRQGREGRDGEGEVRRGEKREEGRERGREGGREGRGEKEEGGKEEEEEECNSAQYLVNPHKACSPAEFIQSGCRSPALFYHHSPV